MDHRHRLGSRRQLHGRDGSRLVRQVDARFPASVYGWGNDAQLRLVLRNDDRRFTPENSAGPLSGKLAPLRPVKVESHDGTTTRRHFSGWVQSIHPAANQNGERKATIRVAGAMQFLKATETKIELQENQRSDQIIDALIQEVIFPLGEFKMREQTVA